MDSKLIKKLDSVFSEYVRLRDTLPSGMCRCISCGRLFPYSQVDCGHFFSRGNMATRWDEENCNAECIMCNRFDEDHLKGYAKNLTKKIGKDKFDEMRIRAHSTKKYHDFELKELLSHYQQEIKRLQKKTP